MKALRIDNSTAVLDPSAAEPTPEPGEALIRLLRAGIGAADLLRVRQGPPPAGVPGHEFVGVVERVNPAARREEAAAWEGKRVVGSINVACGRCERCRAGLSSHCAARRVLGLLGRAGCLAERFTLPTANLVEVPRGMDDARAAFAQPLSAALHAAQMVRFEGKPYVTVLGDGVVGLLAAQIMARRNASVRLLGTDPARFSLCEKWGVKHRHLDEVGRRQDQDVVIDCTGDGAGLELALSLVRPRGTIVVRSAGPVPAAADEGAASIAPLALNEINVVGARCGSFADAVDLLAREGVEVSSLAGRRFRLAEAATAFRFALESTAKVFVEA